MRAAAARLLVISLRKQQPSSFASSGVRKGDRRVLTRPAFGAFAMMAIAQRLFRSTASRVLSINASRRSTDALLQSHAREPVIAPVFPEASRKPVGYVHRRDPFRVLESELGRDPQLQRIAVFGRENLARHAEREESLRMQGGGHVYARIISVGALETHVFGREIGADPLEEGAKRDPAPLADHAPTLDADEAGDL